MKYIIETDSLSMLNQLVNKLKIKDEILLENFISLDYEKNNNFNEAMGYYLSDDFFGEKKLILLKNSSFLNEKNLNNHLQEVLKTIINSNTQNIIVFHLPKLNLTNNVFSKIKKDFDLIKKPVPRGKDIPLFINKFLIENNLNYKNEIINEITFRAGNNFDLLVNELSKLRLLSTDLTLNLVEKSVYNNRGESIFALIEAIFKANFIKLDNSFQKLLTQGYSAIQILEYLINDLIFLLQLKIHSQNPKAKFSKQRAALAKSLGINPFRILKAQDNARLWSFEKLLDFLEEMINLEIKLMINNSDDQLFILKMNLELFLSNLI